MTTLLFRCHDVDGVNMWMTISVAALKSHQDPANYFRCPNHRTGSRMLFMQDTAKNWSFLLYSFYILPNYLKHLDVYNVLAS